MKNKIWLYRAEKRISQQKLADEVGIARSGLCKIELGHHTPSVEVALRIAKYFGVTVEDLFLINKKGC